ncbi:hypothetical protein Bbelb_300820 [Branchiostoma belcheri]|nr:hypothetical protein Bbelb_300820 [Branchiostoma belcheri]
MTDGGVSQTISHDVIAGSLRSVPGPKLHEAEQLGSRDPVPVSNARHTAAPSSASGDNFQEETFPCQKQVHDLAEGKDLGAKCGRVFFLCQSRPGTSVVGSSSRTAGKRAEFIVRRIVPDEVVPTSCSARSKDRGSPLARVITLINPSLRTHNRLAASRTE